MIRKRTRNLRMNTKSIYLTETFSNTATTQYPHHCMNCFWETNKKKRGGISTNFFFKANNLDRKGKTILSWNIFVVKHNYLFIYFTFQKSHKPYHEQYLLEEFQYLDGVYQNE